MLVSDKKANNYLKKVINLLKTYDSELESIILFGSHARNDYGPFSDVDLLIVFKKRDKRLFKSIISKIRFLELQFGYTEQSNNIVAIFLNYLNIATGMFRSWFVCSIEDLKGKNFAKITNTNFLINKILAPSTLVLSNIKRDGVVLYGNKQILDYISTNNLMKVQPVRSLIMNSLLSIGALTVSPVSKKSQLYSLEAIKWSMFVLKGLGVKNTSLSDQLQRHLHIYFTVKKTGIYNPQLSILAPIIILELHKLVFYELKKIKILK